MGYGFKTIALIAVDASAVPADEEVIAIAETGWAGGGADCAIVVKPAHVYGGEFINLEKGMEVREMLAIPRSKFTKEMVENIRRSGYHL